MEQRDGSAFLRLPRLHSDLKPTASAKCRRGCKLLPSIDICRRLPPEPHPVGPFSLGVATPPPTQGFQILRGIWRQRESGKARLTLFPPAPQGGPFRHVVAGWAVLLRGKHTDQNSDYQAAGGPPGRGVSSGHRHGMNPGGTGAATSADQTGAHGTPDRQREWPAWAGSRHHGELPGHGYRNRSRRPRCPPASASALASLQGHGPGPRGICRHLIDPLWACRLEQDLTRMLGPARTSRSLSAGRLRSGDWSLGQPPLAGGDL